MLIDCYCHLIDQLPANGPVVYLSWTICSSTMLMVYHKDHRDLKYLGTVRAMSGWSLNDFCNWMVSFFLVENNCGFILHHHDAISWKPLSHFIVFFLKWNLWSAIQCLRSVIIAMPLSMSVMHCYAAAGIPVRERSLTISEILALLGTIIIKRSKEA